MKLYNKGGRAFIVAKDNVISGGRAQVHDLRGDRLYFDPGTNIEIKDAAANKMLRDYPQSIIGMGDSVAAPKARKRVVKKKIVNTVKA